MVGVASLLWPMVLFLHKRHVLGAQWLLAAAMTLFGIALILYSTLFNNFRRGEYLLVLLFMLFGLVAPPLVYVALVVLTRPQGVSLRARGVFLPPLLMWALLGLSVAVGGADMYRLWIVRGAEGDAGQFFSGSWRYNTIVLVHYYLFWAALLAETLVLGVAAVRMLRRYRTMLSEYYTDPRNDDRAIRRLTLGLTVTDLLLVASYSLFPFNCWRPVWVAASVAAVQVAGLLYAGWHMYHLGRGAEQLSQPRGHQLAARDSRALALRITEHIERHQAFLNPYLSVPMLAQELHLTEDDIIDAVHRLHGTTFGDYVNGLRIEHAVRLMADLPAEADPSQLDLLAHRCGYSDAETFSRAYAAVMQQRFKV